MREGSGGRDLEPPPHALALPQVSSHEDVWRRICGRETRGRQPPMVQTNPDITLPFFLLLLPCYRARTPPRTLHPHLGPPTRPCKSCYAGAFARVLCPQKRSLLCASDLAGR